MFNSERCEHPSNNRSIDKAGRSAYECVRIVGERRLVWPSVQVIGRVIVDHVPELLVI